MNDNYVNDNYDKDGNVKPIVNMTIRAALETAVNELGLEVPNSIECSICREGTIHFDRDADGRFHGQCTTEKCVRWVE